MTKAEFLQQLEALLGDLSPDEREDALHYYSEYFDDAAPATEQEVVEDLGGPQKVANIIRANLGLGAAPKAPEPPRPFDFTQQADNAAQGAAQNAAQAAAQAPVRPANSSNTVLWVLLLIFTFPIWFAVLNVLFWVAVAIAITVFSLVVVGAVLVATGVLALLGVGTVLTAAPANALLVFGAALVCIALGILLCMFFGWLLSVSCKLLFGALGNLCRWLFGGRKVGQTA